MTPIVEFWSRGTPPLTLLLQAALATSALAQPSTHDTTRAAARELGAQGIEAYQAGNYPDANRKLEKAYRLFATPTLGLWSGRSRVQLGQWVEAAERYREAQRVSAAVGDSALQQQAQREASAELSALVPRIPTVTIELVESRDEAGISLTLDGAIVSSELLGVRMPLNPGAHRIVVSRGSERAEVEVRLSEKEHKRVPLRFVAAPVATTKPAQPADATAAAAVVPTEKTSPAAAREAPAASPPAPVHHSVAPTATAAQLQVPRPAEIGAPAPTPAADAQPREHAPAVLRPVAIVSLALGSVGLATCGVTALMAVSKCSGGDCASRDDKDKYDALRTASTVTGLAGAALAAGGLVAWFLAPAKETLSWEVGLLGVNVRGAL